MFGRIKDKARRSLQAEDATACVCALALAFAIGSAPLSPLFAHADDMPAATEPAEDISEPEPPTNPGEHPPADEEGESGSADSASIDSEKSSDENLPDSEEQTPESSDVQEPDVAEPQDEEGPSATGAASAALQAPEQQRKPRAKTQSKLEGKMTKKQQAAELRAQADAIFAQMNVMAAEWDTCQAEYDEAERALENAKAAGKETRQKLKTAKKRLNKLRKRMSEYVVEQYKRGGVTPYLDALVRSTSYREFITAWCMLDEVSQFGKKELHARIEAVESIEAEANAHEGRIKDAEKAAHDAQSKLNRAKLMYLSLAPHVSRLDMEAATLEGDKSAAAAARADYEAANAALEEAIASGLKIDGKLEGQGFFTHPCPGATYSSGFGYRTFDNSYHLGLDMAAGEGTPYYAADDGVVVDATNDGGYNGGAGNWIVIEHANGVVTKYMHSLSTLVRPGDRVVRGQAIGLVGNTGNSFGAHLHFQVEVGGTAVDPTIYL